MGDYEKAAELKVGRARLQSEFDGERIEPLNGESVSADLMIKEVEERLQEHGVTIELTPEAKDWLADKGFDPVYGARPLRRAIQRFVENPLSKQIIAGDFRPGDMISVSEEDGELFFTKTSAVLPMVAEA